MNEEYNSLDAKISAKFQKHLEYGEYIIYCGKSAVVADGKYSKGYNLFFASIWTGFSLFWTFSVWTMSGGTMAFFGIPFILIGISLFANIFKGGNVPFAITNMRILKITGSGLDMEYLKNITHVQANPNGKNADVFYSIEYKNGQDKIGACGSIGGLSAEEADNVCHIIASAKAQMYT